MNPLQIAEAVALIRQGGGAHAVPHVLIADVLDALHSLAFVASIEAAEALKLKQTKKKKAT